MAEYKCDHCGMGVSGTNCVKCGKELLHDHLTKDDGTQVAIAKCPEGHVKIKSPMCCGHDMVCELEAN